MSDHHHSVRKADFAERAAAFGIDYALFAFAWVVILKAIDPGLSVFLNSHGTAAIAVLLAVFIVYQAIFSSDGRVSAGKRIVGLRVVDEEGQALDFGAAVTRSLAYLPSSFLTLGFFWALIDPKGRTWHDFAAGSEVVTDLPPGGARVFALRFAGGFLVIALALASGWYTILEPRYLKVLTVANAKAGLSEVKDLQAAYYQRNGRYAGSLFALAEVSINPQGFLRDMAILYDLRAFRFKSERSRWVVATRARDVDSTLVAVSGP